MCEQSVFQRYEIKFLLSAKQYCAVVSEIAKMTKADSHGTSNVRSLYFDTPDNLLIRRSLEKPEYKEKLRLRSYGAASADSNVYLEIKKKCKDVVYKRRIELKYKNALSYISGKSAADNDQIFREIDYFMSFYGNLRPAMLLTYNRNAYYGENDGLRITIDTDILFRNYDLDLSSGVYGDNVLPDGVYALMEIKTGNSIPMWLARLLSENGVYKSSFSKYGEAYKKVLSGDFSREEYKNVG